MRKNVQEPLFIKVIKPTSPSEVFNALARLKAYKSSGLGNTPPFLLKTAAIVITTIRSFFINLSFELGYFPSSLKEVKVNSVFKVGDKLLMFNYRPISILSSLFKIFQKIIYKRLFSCF